MTIHRAAISLAGAASILAFATPAVAQVDDEIVLSIMRQCARIDDPAARLACYDNNIRSAGANPRNNTVRSNRSAPQADSSVGAQGFGGEDVRTTNRAPERYTPPAPAGAEADEITATVASVTPREPGIYLVTLEDGAQWLFTDPVSNSFAPPRRGDTVEVMRGSMGSYLLRFDNQQPVRVRRVR